jgi:argininosuccinate lyase
MNAWAAATYLVQRGVPSRMAHEAVGKAVRASLDRGCELGDLNVQELKEIHPAFDVDFGDCLTLNAVIAIHDVVGGTALAGVQEAIVRAEEAIAKVRGEVHAHA